MHRVTCVTKRNGTKESIDLSKIRTRLDKLCKEGNPLSKDLDLDTIVRKTAASITNNISTRQLDLEAASTSAYLCRYHPDYSDLGGRICVSDLHKSTSNTFAGYMETMKDFTHPITNENMCILSDDLLNIVKKYPGMFDSWIDFTRDFQFDFFGFKTLERSYLLRTEEMEDGKIITKIQERPSYLYMRVALGIWSDYDLDRAKKTYDYLSLGYFTHATPTLFNAGTKHAQLASCKLIGMKEDSIEGIYDTLKLVAMESKYASGIGMPVTDIRATNSYIKGTNGHSNGIVPMLKVYDYTAAYVDQGGGKRKGSVAIYIEPWHADVEDFIELKLDTGAEERRSRTLFYGMWMNDLFMKRAMNNEQWSLFCPNEAPGLSEVYGEEFERLYCKYETDGIYRKQMSARELFYKICDAQIETGTPYMCYKDHVNRKSNQQNLGTIKCSNLCTEIMEYTSPDEMAVCNLATVALPKMIVDNKFDFERLEDVVRLMTRNLNRVIDIAFYPTEESKNSNLKHRPIGIGVQGLADMFCMLDMPFTSEEAKELNKQIFETIYFAALDESCEISKVQGPYKSFAGSPVSKGILQFDMWDKHEDSGRYEWDALKTRIKKYGVSNSLLIAPPPTASTAQILGNNESIEPFTTNMYNRRVLSGEFIVINKHMVRKLVSLGLWSDEVSFAIMNNRGSIQNIDIIPMAVREVYKTVWEISQKELINMAADRGVFIDQSQSLNMFIAQPTKELLVAMHLYAWKKGLKTGMYYLRTLPKADAKTFDVKLIKMDSGDIHKETSDSSRLDEEKEEEEKVVDTNISKTDSSMLALMGITDKKDVKDAMDKFEVHAINNLPRFKETECEMCSS